MGSQSHVVFDPGRLRANTTYHWRVDAKYDDQVCVGREYRFTTGYAPAQPGRPEENGALLLRDDFGAPNGNWKPIYIKGAAGGGFRIAEGKLRLHADMADTVFGVYNTTPVNRHFYAENGYDADDFAGMALIQQKDGKPDVENYAMMSLDCDGGVLYVTANDRQDGAPDVLGTKHGVPSEQYRVRLDGTQFSVPFKGTAKQFRLMHEALWGSFRYLFKVQGEFKGKLSPGWMETRGSPDWSENPANEKYYVALLVKAGMRPGAEASFNDFRVVRKPTEDRDDTNTGFVVSRGEYNWSGYFDDAVVVTFGKEFPYAGDDRKFVFWGCSNDTPHWHINNQAIYYNEFLEDVGGPFDVPQSPVFRADVGPAAPVYCRGYHREQCGAQSGAMVVYYRGPELPVSRRSRRRAAGRGSGNLHDLQRRDDHAKAEIHAKTG